MPWTRGKVGKGLPTFPQSPKASSPASENEAGAHFSTKTPNTQKLGGLSLFKQTLIRLATSLEVWGLT